jgi:hypothetical protein
MRLFLEGNDEDMRRHENKQTSNFSFLFFSKLPFWGIYRKKISTFTFGCTVIPLNPIWSIPSEKPKRFGI